MSCKLFNRISTFLSPEKLQVISFTSISTLVRFFAGFVSIKLFAVFIGPEGLALTGNLNNFIAILSALASLGISNGVIKFISEFKSDTKQIKALISTGFKMIIISTIFASFVLLGFASFFSKKVLLSEDFVIIIVFLAIGLPSTLINSFLLNILNGFKEFQKLAIVSVVGGLITILLTSGLVYLFHLKGALITIVCLQPLILCCTFFLVRKEIWFKSEYFFAKIDMFSLKRYSSFTIMSITTALLLPVSQFYMRNQIITKLSFVDAGQWEAVNKLSSSYLSIWMSMFSMYYLPRLAEISEKGLVLKEIKQSALFFLPIVAIIQVAIYLFKHQIVLLVFSQKFSAIETLISFQLFGDFFKVASYLLGYVIVAKAMTKMYVFAEFFSTISFLLLATVLLFLNGLIGMVQAYMLNYILYFFMLLIFCYFYFREGSRL